MQAVTMRDIRIDDVTLKRKYIENACGLKDLTNNILCLMDGMGYITAREVAAMLESRQEMMTSTLRRVYDVLTILRTVGWVNHKDDKYEYRGPKYLCTRIVYIAMVKAYSAREFLVMRDVSRNTAGVTVSQIKKLSIDEAVAEIPIQTDKLIEVLDVEMLGYLMRHTTLENSILSEYVRFKL